MNGGPSPLLGIMNVSLTRVPLPLFQLRRSITAHVKRQLCTNALRRWRRLGRLFKFMTAVGYSKPYWPRSHTRSIFQTLMNLRGASVSIIFRLIMSPGFFAFPIPRCDMAVGMAFGLSKFHWMYDTLMGYHQLSVSPETQEKLAFWAQCN